MEHLTPLLIVLRLGAAALTVVLIVLAGRAWRRSKDTRMMRLALGFVALLTSLLIEGAMYQYVAPNDLLLAHIVEAGAQFVAFGVLVWALF